MTHGIGNARASRILVSAAMFAAFAVALAAAGALLAPTSVQTTISHYFVLIVLVVGLGCFVGNTGILSFGHVSFVAVAAYVSALLTLPPALKKSLLPHLPGYLDQLHFSFWLSLPLSVALTLVVGVLSGILISRVSGAAAAISTLALLIITNSVLIGASDFTRGSQAIYGVSKEVGVWIGAISAVVAYLAGRVFKDSRQGLAARAVREDEPAARSVGIDVKKSRLAAWVASVGIIAAGGVLYAHQITVFSPKEFHFDLMFALLAMLIVGGMTSVSGAVVGTTLVVGLIELLRRLEEGGVIFGMQIPHMFGLTEVGLSLAVLITLYKRGSGVMGFREFEDLFWRRQPSVSSGTATQAVAHQSFGTDAQLRAISLTKRYGGVTALKDVTLTLKKGEVVGLIGPNGSGKSTLLACLSGANPATSGEVTVGDKNATGALPEMMAHLGVGRTFQNIRLFRNLTVRENVEAAMISVNSARGQQEIHYEVTRLLERLSLVDFEYRAAGTLSYGDQRRLEIARALAISPDFLLLDEPAAGMNEKESEELVAVISDLRDNGGLGIILVDHDLHMILSLCDTIVVLNKGEVIANGPPEEIRTNPAVIEAYIGTASTPQDFENQKSREGATV